MTRPRAALALVVTCTVLGVAAGGFVGIVTAPLAHAQTSGDGYFSEGSLGAGITDTAKGVTDTVSNLVTGRGPSAGSSGGTPSPYTTVRHYYGDHSDPTYGVSSPFTCPTNPDGSQQMPYEDVTTDTRTGAVTNRSTGCEGQTQPGAAGQPAAPMPPTAAELWNATPVPLPTPGIKGAEGLTGAATWLYDPNGTGGVGVTVQIRGYTATSSAGPQRWEWDMTASGPESKHNPPGEVSSDRPGSASDPAGTYTYETAGDYRITERVVWSGSFTFSGNGQPAQTRSLGTTTRTATFGYHVTSSLPVLVGS